MLALLKNGHNGIVNELSRDVGFRVPAGRLDTTPPGDFCPLETAVLDRGNLRTSTRRAVWVAPPVDHAHPETSSSEIRAQVAQGTPRVEEPAFSTV